MGWLGFDRSPVERVPHARGPPAELGGNEDQSALARPPAWAGTACTPCQRTVSRDGSRSDVQVKFVDAALTT